MTEWISILGFIAGTCTTVSFLPQVIKSIKTKDTKSISLIMYSTLVSGIFLWLIYGFLILDYPVIMANGITFVLALIVLFLKIKHG